MTPSERRSLRDWQNRIANWKLGKNADKPIEFHLLRIQEELSECSKELRNGHSTTEVYYNPKHPEKPEGFPIELAQVVRECLWLAEVSGIDLETMMLDDQRYQEARRIKKKAKVAK